MSPVLYAMLIKERHYKCSLLPPFNSFSFTIRCFRVQRSHAHRAVMAFVFTHKRTHNGKSCLSVHSKILYRCRRNFSFPEGSTLRTESRIWFWYLLYVKLKLNLITFLKERFIVQHI